MKSFSKILFSFLGVVILLFGYTPLLNPPAGNWYQQFMPNIGNRQITDITFLDSLTGFAVTTLPTLTDTSFILKTTNRGDNWVINHRDSGFIFRKVQFINKDTGFVGGTHFMKTTNAGTSWSIVSTFLYFDDMFVLSNDTAWFVKSESLTGGVFRTTNGGASWDRQLDLGSQNPVKIYMFNSRIGYIAKNTGSSYIRKTTNSGINWDTIVNGRGFNDIFFVDSLTGWTAFDSVRKTTDGGLNWQTQVLPSGFGIATLFPTKFSHLNSDTIWLGGGRMIYPNSQARGMLFRTTNGGSNWLYQVPDTAIVAGIYSHVEFVDKNKGWANTGFVLIHTTTGGDPLWISGINQISNEIPKQFKLFQNYPNPFNPVTKIKYQILNNKFKSKSKAILIVYDIQGKEMVTLVNEQQSAGTYEVDFWGAGYSSGVYFYTLMVDNSIIGTMKMILLK